MDDVTNDGHPGGHREQEVDRHRRPLDGGSLLAALPLVVLLLGVIVVGNATTVASIATSSGTLFEPTTSPGL